MVSGSVRAITKMVSLTARNVSSRPIDETKVTESLTAAPRRGLPGRQGRLHARQRVPHVDAFAVRLADVKVARQHGLHVFEH
jgi:hypothetical protein